MIIDERWSCVSNPGGVVRGVWFAYPGCRDWALSDVDLRIPHGTHVAVVGSTGVLALVTSRRQLVVLDGGLPITLRPSAAA